MSSNNNKVNYKSGKTMLFSTVLSFILIGLDQITKYLVAVNLKGQPSFSLIDGVFEFKYLENQSAAFSLDLVSIIQRIFRFSYFENNPSAFLMCKMIFFVVITLVVLIVIVILYRRIPWNRHYMFMNLILIGFFCGALGNLIDRIVHNYVIDFFYFSLINFPIFNVADIYVTVAAIALIIAVFFIYKDEDYNVIFPSKSKQANEQKEK